MYYILNFSVTGGSLAEAAMDKTLKDKAYGAKTTLKVSGEASYTLVLVPAIVQLNPQNAESVAYLQGKINNSLNDVFILESVVEFLGTNFNEVIRSTKTLSIDLVTYLDEDKLGISYSDGSGSVKYKKAGYGVCHLKEETTDPNQGIYESFTGKRFLYETSSGGIDNGTNNIGELTGVSVIADNFDHHDFQLIVSDSEYALRIFREYYHNWKRNGFLTYSKKPIANKDLILEIHEKLYSKNKIIIYKWTKGHADDEVNILCDSLASIELENLCKKEVEGKC